MISRYTKEEVDAVIQRVLSVPESEYIMNDNLDGELDNVIGKYLATGQLYGKDRVKKMPYIRKMFTITKLIMEQYDDTKITVNVQPNGKDGRHTVGQTGIDACGSGCDCIHGEPGTQPKEGMSQTPSIEGDRQTSDNHADCHDEDATVDITKENR